MIVYVRTHQWHSQVYHTDQNCQHLPDDPDKYRQVEKHTQEPIIKQCETCKSKQNIETEQPNKTCPFCGERVGKLPPHLPCNGVKANAD